MIPRSHRFHGQAGPKYVYRNGQIVRCPYFSIKYVQNPKRRSYRAAVVVSRKVAKSAVKRNRIRRCLYGALNNQQTTIKAPYDMVITIFTESVNDLSSAELQKQLNRLLKQARIF